jgi:hypothetical protein
MSGRLGTSWSPGERANNRRDTRKLACCRGTRSSGLAAVAGRTDSGGLPAKLDPAMRPRHYGEVW